MLKVLSALIFAVFASSVHADWQLDGEASSLQFVSIKKASIAENNIFTTLSGSVDDTGLASLFVELDSVDTRIPIRNERMRKYLFQTDAHAQAIVVGKVEVDKIKTLAVGEQYKTALELDLSLHGQQKGLTAEVEITRLGQNKIMVLSVSPVIINAADFSLLEGVAKLKELAGLNSISTAVPVTVKLIYTME